MRRAAIRTYALVIVSLLFAACGNMPTGPSGPPPNEALLTQAGFKTIPATTQAQKEHLQALPQARLTAWQQTGKHYYVYPDVASNKLFVGTPKEYQAYLDLRTKNGLANPEPVNQTAADMRSYLRQDAQMQQADALAAQVPPWAIWPDFSNLGWIP